MKKISLVIFLILTFLICNSLIILGEDEYITDLKAKLENDPENVGLLKEIGIYYHGLAEKGDKKAVKEALHYLEIAMKLAPEDNTLKAWYGSVLTMVGRDSINPLTKYFKVKDGLKYLDEAVESEPDNYEIRLARAMTTMNIPDNVFGRLQQSIDDFAYLINKEKAEPGYMPEKEKLMAYLNIGIALKTAGNLETAVKVWQKLIEMAPDSTEGKEAQKLIKQYSF